MRKVYNYVPQKLLCHLNDYSQILQVHFRAAGEEFVNNKFLKMIDFS